MRRTFRELGFWSPTLGGDSVRLSMWDARGSEYWTIIPRILGRSYREARTAALEMIQKAIDGGASREKCAPRIAMSADVVGWLCLAAICVLMAWNDGGW